MLAGGDDPGYRDLLKSGFHPYTRVEVWRSGERIDSYGSDGVPFFSGSISATLTSQVTRQLSMQVDESLWPADETGLLAPYGNELRVWQGIRGAGAQRSSGEYVPYTWQTFRGRINECTLQTNGVMTIGALDRAADVNDAGFNGPENSTAGVVVTTEFRRLVNEGVIDATFGTFDVIAAVTPILTWEWDRGGACDDLATAASAYWYALANGDYVMREVPWTKPQTPILTLSDGPTGELVSAQPTISRENVFNVVTVVGERADGTAPVFATVSDFNVDSPTYVDGPFGVKAKLVRAQAAQNQAQANTIANTTLSQARALTQSWDIELPVDPSIELGDTFIIDARDLPQQTQVVASFALPLTADTMSISLRALQPGLLEE